MTNDRLNLLFEKIKVLDDEEAFRQLFEELYAPLCLYANKIVPGAAVEDMVQDVFVTFWERRRDLILESSIKSYFVISIRNKCLNYTKHSAIRNQYNEYIMKKAPTYTQVDELLTLHELEYKLGQILENLPEEYRIAFVMGHMRKQKTSAIAKELGVSERTVERYKKRAMEIIKLELKDYFPLLLTLLTSYSL